MSRPDQQKPIFTATAYSPIRERGIDEADIAATGCGGCFRRFCCFGSAHDVESHNYLLREGGGAHKDEAWIVAEFKKVKEFSELVAGPKWKNFIRKIGKICNPKKYNKQFQYSPESYALNFAGDQYNQEEDDGLLHSFSSRFAAGPLINEQQRTASL